MSSVQCTPRGSWRRCDNSQRRYTWQSRKSKRHRVVQHGAGDTKGELKTALKRKGDGRAAIAIVRVVGTPSSDAEERVRYLVQVKSHDYPIEAFRGTVCLLGGNANANDETPLETLLRELREELHDPDWVDDIDAEDVIDDSGSPANVPLFNSSSVVVETGTVPPVRYLGTTLHFQSSTLLAKPNPYAFLCALYEITLRPEQLPPSVIYPRGANVQEGRVVLLTENQLVRNSGYAWGYEHTMGRYFGRKATKGQKGTAVSDVDEATLRETVWTPAK